MGDSFMSIRKTRSRPLVYVCDTASRRRELLVKSTVTIQLTKLVVP
jgi:hypothetical protein